MFIFNQIIKVSFGGKDAPRSSTTSNNKKMWIAIGLTLSILIVLLIIVLVSSKVLLLDL